MSVFVKSLKTFESDITGEKREYKINNAVWVFMKSKFDLTQSQWATQYGEEEVINGARFIVCVLCANGLEVTEKEVIENTNAVDVINFTVAYQTAMVQTKDDIHDEPVEDAKGK